MVKKILISFPEDEEDIKIYLEIKGQPKKKQSEFVRKALKEFIDRQNKRMKSGRKPKNKKNP